MPPALRATLVGVARRMARAREPWWVITGAAAALHGVEGEVGDVDLLVGLDDAPRLLGHARPGVASERYRSAIFGTLDDLPLPVEVMAGFELFVDGAWRRVSFASREPVTVDTRTLFVPARAELAAWLTAIGRPKDLRRAAILAS